VLDVALALGRSEADVRELVKPQKRSGGFTRPRYLTYANKSKTHVKAIGCPHDRCKGRRFADHVVLLPEVAASGYGIICTHCRRTPASHHAWPSTQFPNTYLGSWTPPCGWGQFAPWAPDRPRAAIGLNPDEPLPWTGPSDDDPYSLRASR